MAVTLPGGAGASSFYTEEELAGLGFMSIGRDVEISRYARFYNMHCISIGSSSRIDDFAVISASGEGSLSIGIHVHIASHVIIYASSPILMADFSGLSARCTVYGSTDDFLFGAMTNPTLPLSYRNVSSRRIQIGKHCVVGCGTVIMPGVTLGDYCSVGALSYVDKDIPPGMVAKGNPARPICKRDVDHLLELERSYMREEENNLK